MSSVFIKLMFSVDEVDRGRWFGAAAILGLPIGWPWLHEYVSLAQINHPAASTTMQNIGLSC